MPNAPTMILLRGKGGHLSTEEYSIIVARTERGLWQGTAVGRSRTWVKDAPYTPMKRAEWVLDAVTAQRLDEAISRTCPLNRVAKDSTNSEPPPLGYVPEIMDIVTPGHAPYSFGVSEGGEYIAALVRPPR